jgi:hypothetical protein
LNAQPRGRRTVGLLRSAAYYVSFLVISLGVTLVFAASTVSTAVRIAYLGIAIAIAVILVLLVHQRFGKLTVVSATLVPLAFVVPAVTIRTTWESSGCGNGVPCDAYPVGHDGLAMSLVAIFLAAALFAAIVGLVRSRTRGVR